MFVSKSRKRKYITSEGYCVSIAVKFDVFCQKWPFLSKTSKNGYFEQKTSNLTTFETQHLSDVVYFLFLLFEMDVLSYLPPFYHNFENFTLYGIFPIFRPSVGGVQIFQITFYFITGLGAYLNNVGKWSEKKGQEKHPKLYICKGASVAP